MGISIRAGSAWRVLTLAKVYVGGRWRAVRTIRVYRDGAWRVAKSFAPAMSAVAVPSSAYGYEADNKPKRVFSEPITAILTGGQAPFSYQWTVIDADREVALGGAAMATVTVSAILFNSSGKGSLQCLVTDAAGTTATCSTTFTLTHSDLS